MRILVLALLLVSLLPAEVLARGRNCGSYRAPRVRYHYGYRAPRVRYHRTSTPRFSIYHTATPQRRTFPQTTAPLNYHGQYPQIVHSAGIEYLKPELGPREVAAP